jgi:asparagine N-glycosylation enzyme membrane subunit Stt3
MSDNSVRNTTASLLAALLAAALFYLAASARGYQDMDIYGGTVYTFLLSLIVALSLLPKIVLKKI